MLPDEETFAAAMAALRIEPGGHPVGTGGRWGCLGRVMKNDLPDWYFNIAMEHTHL